MTEQALTVKYTFQNLLDSYTSGFPAVDKRQGSIVYDSGSAFLLELTQYYIELEKIENNQYPDTADRESLLKMAREQGIVIETATPCISRGVFNLNVPIGSRWNQGDMNFTARAQLNDTDGNPIYGNFEMVCDTAGTIGNAYLGPLIPISQSIPGLARADLTEVLIPGRDDEDTESIREKVIASYFTMSYGFNRAQYISVTESLPGVGGAKAQRAPTGGGTVSVQIINSEFKAPSDILITEIQTALDPVVNAGEGYGLVPIGHRCTVTGVRNVTIDVGLSVTLREGWTWDDVLPQIEDRLDNYFLTMAKAWADEPNLVVRGALIITNLITVTGLLDILEVQLNGADVNVPLEFDEIPILGAVTQIV
ncbi:baseplate J/gp47 family protein [Methanolapillus millepedarum]|uniref:Baseplate J/gp47 family protein n=1 Tax=Methanolapillus millepedarum TaxID=3028296 RepID=A0AA97A4Z4_9EURY|nr:hypothetical protein MsAc7_17560 [Methanosarcinaceae archaeon Ac7]